MTEPRDDGSGYSPTLDGSDDDSGDEILDPDLVDFAAGLADPTEIAQILRGFELLQAPCNSRRGNRPSYEPTPEEIRAMCAAIRTEWSPGETRARAGTNSNERAKVRTVRVSDDIAPAGN